VTSDPVPESGETRLADTSHPLLVETLEKLRQRAAAEPGESSLLLWMEPALARGELRLPLVRGSVMRVMELMHDEDVDLGALSLAVEADPSLATKVVGIANSSYFRGTEATLAVRPALLRMGLDEARNVVAAVVVRSSVFSLPGLAEQAEELWRHSALTGLACQALLEDHAPLDESGFLLGLVHDVGRLVVLARVAELRQARRGVKISDEALESAMDALHAELGALVALAWGFPPLFVEAVRNHHGPEGSDGLDNLLAFGLYAADTVANLYQRDWRPGNCEENDAIVRDLLEPLGIDLPRCEKLLSELEGGFTALASLV
jgi:HD-like signal output (HDOD) protein